MLALWESRRKWLFSAVNGHKKLPPGQEAISVFQQEKLG